MSKSAFKPIIFFLLLVCSFSAFAQQKKVAVYVTGKDTEINKVLGDKLVAAFAKSGKYIAIERTASFLAEISKEQSYQRTGAVDDNELSRLGKQFGVQLVCVADVSDVFGEKYVSARLIDVESAEVINTSNATSKLGSMQELLKVTDALAKELTAKTVQEKAEEARAKQIAEEAEINRLRKAITDGYIQIDNIMVAVSNNYSRMKYKQAIEEANACKLGGYNNWRLPSPSEISMIKNAFDRYHSINEDFPRLERYYPLGCSGNLYDYNGEIKRNWLNISGCYVVFVRDIR